MHCLRHLWQFVNWETKKPESMAMNKMDRCKALKKLRYYDNDNSDNGDIKTNTNSVIMNKNETKDITKSYND